MPCSSWPIASPCCTTAISWPKARRTKSRPTSPCRTPTSEDSDNEPAAERGAHHYLLWVSPHPLRRVGRDPRKRSRGAAGAQRCGQVAPAQDACGRPEPQVGVDQVRGQDRKSTRL